MKEYQLMGWARLALCSGKEQAGCECHSGQPHRKLPVYRECVAPPSEILLLCDPCRTRLERAGEITVKARE